MPQIGNVPEKVAEVFSLLVDSVLALQRENKEVLWGSMVKETMKRKKPSFNETYYGFRTFSHLLEDAQRRGIVELRRDQKSGSYVIEDLGSAGIGTEKRPEQSGPVGVPAMAPASSSRAVEAPKEAEVPAGPVAVEASADAANGTARPPRRRRSRSRRPPRSASALAAGAFPDTGATNAEGAHGADESDADAGDDQGDHGDHGDAYEADQHQDHVPAAHDEAKAPPEKPAGEDTGPFSFFSWMRREPDPKRDPPK
jgi:hypothetical protein